MFIMKTVDTFTLHFIFNDGHVSYKVQNIDTNDYFLVSKCNGWLLLALLMVAR